LFDLKNEHHLIFQNVEIYQYILRALMPAVIMVQLSSRQRIEKIEFS